MKLVPAEVVEAPSGLARHREPTGHIRDRDRADSRQKHREENMVVAQVEGAILEPAEDTRSIHENTRPQGLLRRGLRGHDAIFGVSAD